jgi:hypothetical protein
MDERIHNPIKPQSRHPCSDISYCGRSSTR